ncbi:unnamed protein product, partial [Taenia asiatica]|uniref:HTH CENPB-type domain-containing protein n=1 Tax=Taenia asiatica TaxID=60517 RepID=A0A0R3W060_TAEAS
MNSMNTVYDIKYLIGRLLNNEAVQSKAMLWPFRKINGKPGVKVKYCDKAKHFTAEEIQFVVLLDMKKTAEAYLGKPMAAALAYGVDKRVNSQHSVQFRFGWRHLRRVCHIYWKLKLEVKAVGGNKNAGGGKFNSKLVKYCMKTLKQEH